MLTDNEAGGYAYARGLRFASNGVVALPGMVIERGLLAAPVPLERGFEAVERHLWSAQRPVEALCGMELRLPATLSLERFVEFNDRYLEQLDRLGLLRDGASPLTRTNVSPHFDAPDEPSVLACSYTVPGDPEAPSFVISGIAELPLAARYPEGIVRAGETSPEALLEKARCVVEVVDGHISSLGVGWTPSASVHLYSAHDIAFQVVREVLPGAGAVPAHGIVWHDAAPPVADLELEIDVRRYSREVAVRS